MPDLGIDHVCSKPFSPSELTGLVVDILNRRPAIDVRVAAEVAEDADQI
jgi:DNA-binding response OmpR family regulator